MKKKYIKMFVINIVVTILSIVVLSILGNSIIGTIAFAVWGEESGWIATNIIIRVLMSVVLALGVHIQNMRNEKDYDEYISIMKNKNYEYNFKSDIDEIVKAKNYWVELVFFTIFSLIMMAVVQNPKWMFLIAIPFYLPINLFSHVLIHKSWIKRKTKI